MVSVFLYVPNLIGYARILLMAFAFLNWTDPLRFFLLYSASFGLDAWDGYFARLLDQSSELGAVLDMITDRCGTANLLVVLSLLYKDFASLFLSLMFLDCFSHWAQTTSGLCSGSTSHKKAGNHSALIRLYYTRPVLTVVCLFTELFFLMLYVLYYQTPERQDTIFHKLLLVFTWGLCFPTFLIKQLVNVKQIVTAHRTLLDTSTISSDKYG